MPGNGDCNGGQAGRVRWKTERCFLYSQTNKYLSTNYARAVGETSAVCVHVQKNCKRMCILLVNLSLQAWKNFLEQSMTNWLQVFLFVVGDREVDRGRCLRFILYVSIKFEVSNHKRVFLLFISLFK